MPAYSEKRPILSCALGETVPFWDAETPTPGGATAASRPVALVPLQGRHGFAVSGRFSANPGTWQIDVQLAAIDQDNAYALSTAPRTDSDPTNFSFFFSTEETAPFVRLYLKTRSNNVSVTASVSRY